jgi:hypothetical protein
LTPLMDRIATRLEQMLASSAIPVPLQIDGWYDGSESHAGAVWFRVRAREQVLEVCDCSDQFGMVARNLTNEFGGELGTSVGIDAPAQLRGPTGLLRQNEIDRDKADFSKARLKDLPHG